MTTAIDLDHVAIGGPALPVLEGAYERLGFTLTPLARHRGLATGNRCIMLRQGYLELIALVAPSAPAEGFDTILARYDGLHIVALGIDDADATLDRLRRAGLDVPGIAHLARPVDDTDPDGAQARFERLPLPDAPEGRIQLIRHLTREAIWQERFMTHPNNAIALEEVVLAVPVPAETAARFSRLAGLPVTPDPAGGFALALPRGRVRIVPPESVAQIFPGMTPPSVPSIVGIALRTADGCAALRARLGDVAHAELDAGVLVPPSAACGAAIAFT